MRLIRRLDSEFSFETCFIKENLYKYVSPKSFNVYDFNNTLLFMVKYRLSEVLPKYVHPHSVLLRSNHHFEHRWATLLSYILMQFCKLFSS